MNKLDDKLAAMQRIDNVPELMDECLDLLNGLQKDFDRIVMSRDADILILELDAESKEKTNNEFHKNHYTDIIEYKAVIKYLEGKLHDYC